MEMRTENICPDLSETRRRLVTLVDIGRWVWVVNAVVTMVGAYYGRFDIAALAGFTWAMSLIATAIARRAAASLGESSEARRELAEGM